MFLDGEDGEDGHNEPLWLSINTLHRHPLRDRDMCMPLVLIVSYSNDLEIRDKRPSVRQAKGLRQVVQSCVRLSRRQSSRRRVYTHSQPPKSADRGVESIEGP